MSVYVKSCIINVMQRVSMLLSMMNATRYSETGSPNANANTLQTISRKKFSKHAILEKENKREDVEGLCQHRFLPQINVHLERVMRGDKCLMKSRTALSGLAVGFFLSSLGLKINPSIPSSSIHTFTSLHPFSGPSLR